MNVVLLARLLDVHTGTRVGEACNDAKQDRFLYGFGIVESCCHHVVGLLLIGRFKHWYEGKLAIEARVLFVLA